MGFRGILAELRHRGVLKVAVAYAAIGWVALQSLSLLFQNFDAPDWVIKVVTTLVILGFPIACLMAWGFEFTPQGVRPFKPTPGGPTPKPGSDAPPSIAVLPFVDMSAEHDQQYLGDGIAEELLNALASIEGLNVAARTSSFSLAGRGASMTEIGDTLHVRHVLEGSVRRAGQKLRVTAQLIDVGSGFHLFSQAYDRAVEDIFEIQNEIAHEIASALLPKLGLAQDVMLVKQGTTNLEAYNLRLKAHQWLLSPDPKTFGMAIEQLRRAIALDPSYGDAWGDLGYIYAYSATWARDPMSPMMEASTAAARALAHSPANVAALLAQAFVSMVIHRDPEAAAGHYARARAAGADLSAWAFNKAYVLDGPLGHFDEAIAALADAESKDPLAPTLKWILIEMQLAAGRTAQALETAERLHQCQPRVPGSMAYEAYAYIAAGDLPRAEQSLVELKAATSDDFWHVALIEFAICAVTDKREDARHLLDGLMSKIDAGVMVSPFIIAIGYAALGDSGLAVEWWQRAVEQHHPHWVQMTTRFRCHPVIGKDPRFLALLKRMGLAGDGDATAAGQ